MEMTKKESKAFFQELNILMLLTILTGSVSILLFLKSFQLFWSFLAGSLLAYINFKTLEKEGQDLIFRVYQNVMLCLERPYQKERTLFLIKVYLRLLALGIILYVLITKLSLHPFFIILGFTMIYLQIFVVFIKRRFKKGESF
ncbi:MAG: hypothetical protein ACK40E_05805 [Caldimicrobium sp.]